MTPPAQADAQAGETATLPGQTVRAAEGPVRGRWLREVWASTIGKKIIVAITGVIMGVYVVLHVLGNLKAFQGTGDGAAAIDKYAEWLRTVGEPAIPREGVLWLVRVVLVLALVLHVVAIAQLSARNVAARPPRSGAKVLGRSLSSRTMLYTGILILAFVVFHILHFTTRTIDVTPLGEGTVYANLYNAFQEWYFVAIYVGAALLIGLHLWHGLWSTTQTAGWDKPNRNPSIRRFAAGTALVITVGFAAVPLAYWLEILPEPG